MRIRLQNKCSMTDIVDILDNIMGKYDMNFGTVNLYVTYIKNGEDCDLYNINTLDPAFINNYKEKKHPINFDDKGLVCLTTNNIKYINYVMDCIDEWSVGSKGLMRSFLINKFNEKIDETEQIGEVDLSEVNEI